MLGAAAELININIAHTRTITVQDIRDSADRAARRLERARVRVRCRAESRAVRELARVRDEVEVQLAQAEGELKLCMGEGE